MAKFFSIFLCFLALLQNALSVVVVPKSVDVTPTASSLFTLSDGAGSCSDKITTINTYLSECVELINAALTAYHNYGTVAAYRTMFQLYLSTEFTGTTISSSSGSWTTVETRLANVAKFLSGGGIANAKTSTKPLLVCNDNFAEVKTWMTTARDGNGDEMSYTDEDGDPAIYTIAEVYPKIKLMQAQGVRGRTINANIRPFWISQLNGYTFATLASTYTSLCQKPGRMALTSRADTNAGDEAGSPAGFTYATFNRHMLLCPDSFSPASGLPHSIASLSNLVSSTNYPTVGLKQLPLSTISATLFHELFHMVDTAGTDNDNGLQDVLSIFQASFIEKSDTPVDAPEAYALFATAAYLYQNPPGSQDAVLFGPMGWQT